MAIASRKKTFEELQNLNNKVTSLSYDLYNEIDELLIELMFNDDSYTQSKLELDKAFTTAANDVDFHNSFFSSTIKSITTSTYSTSYSKNFLVGMTFPEYEKVLPRTAMFGDGITLNERTRKASNRALASQRKVLQDSLRAGKDVVSITRELEDIQLKYGKLSIDDKLSTVKKFPSVLNKTTRSLRAIRSSAPEFMNTANAEMNRIQRTMKNLKDELNKPIPVKSIPSKLRKKLESSGVDLDRVAFNNLDQIENLKKKVPANVYSEFVQTMKPEITKVNKRLSGSYKRLSKAIGSGKVVRVNAALKNAIAKKARYNANRVARTESLNSLAEMKIEREVERAEREDIQLYYKTKTTGKNTCAYCYTIEDMTKDWYPAEIGYKPTLHPQCRCNIFFRRAIIKLDSQEIKQLKMEHPVTFRKSARKTIRQRGEIYVNNVSRVKDDVINIPPSVNFFSMEKHSERILEAAKKAA